MACSFYLGKAFSVYSRKKVIRELTKRIKESELDFNAIACRGTSGALIAPCVADRLDKNIMFVRKSLSDSHGKHLVEIHRQNLSSYIIIDDQISTGDTIREIVKEIKLKFHEAKCLGVFLYSRSTRNDCRMDRDAVNDLPVYYIKSQTREDDEIYPLPAIEVKTP